MAALVRIVEIFLWMRRIGVLPPVVGEERHFKTNIGRRDVGGCCLSCHAVSRSPFTGYRSRRAVHLPNASV